MAELSISWQTAERISNEKSKGVATGATAEEAEAATAAKSPLRWTDKPMIVYVCDEAAGCDGFDKLEGVTLKDEKIGLGMKAFRRIKMHPDDVSADEFLKGHGKAVPRMLVINPTNLKVKVLEKGKLKASTLFKAMQKVSDKFYKEKLKATVGTHLKLLTEQDQLANQEKVLNSKMARLGEGKKADKTKDELEKVREELAALRKKSKTLWNLTVRPAKA